jgi:hypothetical protein
MTRLREAIRGRSAKLPSRHRGRNLRQDRGSKKVDRWQETCVGDGFVHHLVFLFFHIILVNPSIFWIARCELLLVIIVIRKTPPRQFKKTRPTDWIWSAINWALRNQIFATEPVKTDPAALLSG